MPIRFSYALVENAGFAITVAIAFDAVDCSMGATRGADVGNTALALVLPCLDKIKALMRLTADRIALAAGTLTLIDLTSDMAMTTWNGLFVHKNTPSDVPAECLVPA